MEQSNLYNQIPFESYSDPNDATWAAEGCNWFTANPSNPPVLPISLPYLRCPSDNFLPGAPELYNYSGSLGPQCTFSPVPCLYDPFLQNCNCSAPNSARNGSTVPPALVPPLFPGYGPSPDKGGDGGYINGNTSLGGPGLSPDNVRGVFNRMGVLIRFTDISDGLSNTFCIGEFLPAQSDLAYDGPVVVQGGTYNYGNTNWARSDSSAALCTTMIPLNYMTPFDQTGNYGQIANGATCTNPATNRANWGVSEGFKSLHTGGANFVFCDGSVHFISQSINLGTYEYLGCRNDGQVFQTTDY
jgi:prepilin-type processing-associated H-X9-DG protein